MQTMYGMLAQGALTELDEIARATAASQPAGAGRRAVGPGVPRAGIRFEGVRFRYPGSDKDVLTGLDLELPAGTSTAIVGLNGAGKTTLVKLLAGLYAPASGRITVDGIDLRELDQRSWEQRLAVIFQDFIRYELDVAANVGMGAPGLLADERALREAISKARAEKVVSSLPAGLATPLSPHLEGGVGLSGGQWQRIAMARALFAVGSGASVLILDEPTAQLDVRAEVAFFDQFMALTAGLTTVVISHRFSTVRRADRIAVLENGRVAEYGEHDALLRKQGRYAALFRLQARRFSDEPASDEGAA
jgi:ATP-binding cassette subfamily B protein